jgi:hypothetical protein
MPPDAAARDMIVAMSESRMVALANQYAAGDIGIGDFQVAMREELRRAYALQIIAGNGGETPAADDWLKLGNALKAQYAYLEGFSADMTAGNVEGDAIASRAALYARSAQTAYWKQATPDMPTYPGEQQCMGNCGCEWVDNGDGSYTWKRGKTDSCSDCIENEQTYANYVPEAA